MTGLVWEQIRFRIQEITRNIINVLLTVMDGKEQFDLAIIMADTLMLRLKAVREVIQRKELRQQHHGVAEKEIKRNFQGAITGITSALMVTGILNGAPLVLTSIHIMVNV